MEKELNEITLLARSETNEPFKVTFKKDESRLTVSCTCPAGLHGEFCEHKFRIASNDIMMLQHPGQNSAMLNAHMWVIDSDMSDVLLNLLHLLGEDEPDREAIEKAQAEVGKVMREGI
jgi:F0F1-type ATP synthase gamma subunit